MRLTRPLLLAALIALTNCGPVRIGRDASLYSSSGSASAAEPRHRSASNRDKAAPAVQVAYRSGAPDFSCAPSAVTCMRINGRDAGGGILPATFGVPFAPGQVPSGTTLAASVRGRTLPLQMDQPSTYPDGSLRFAIFSLALPAGDAGQVVSLIRGGSAGGAPVDPAAWLNAGHDVRLVLNLYSPQVSTITLGNRRGTQAGTPFQAGETITVHLGDDPGETYTVTVTEKTAGGGFGTLSQISRELVEKISHSSRFRPYKIGEGGGYETLWLTTRGGDNAKPFAIRIETSSAAPIRTETLQPYEAPRRYTASAHAMLGRAERSAWLSGSQAGEVLLAGPLVADDGSPHPRLTARMNVRAYAGVPQTRTDVILEDLWAYQPDPRNWHYDVAIEQDGKRVFHDEDVTHYHHARWHKVLWSGADPELFVQYDRHHLLNSYAVQHYDERLVIPSAVIQNDLNNLAKADTAIMGNANVVFYFGTTGGRPDIGPVPRWTTIYLLSMDPREYTVMMANANASGSVPIHFRDRRTGLPVNVDDHAREKLPKVVNGDTPWSPERAHQPSLVYVPYMVTGDRYYLEEVQFWATWNLLSTESGTLGIVLGTLQTRNDAWSLRALAEAAEITPDRDPLKHYYQGKLEQNLTWANARYEKRSNPLGLDAVFNRGNRFAPWQGDFMILVLSQVHNDGYISAETFMRWIAIPTMGVWMNEQNGYCRMNAPPGGLTIRRPSGGDLVTSWAELQKLNFPQQVDCPTSFPKEAYEGSPLGYIINAMAAAAVLSDVDYPGARELFNALNERESKVNFGADPTWRIVPRSGPH